MALPTGTKFDDVRAICGYFATKPMGASRTDAKAVLEARHDRPSKYNALTFWGLLVKDGKSYKITDLGRASAAADEASSTRAAKSVIGNIEAYKSIIERVSHRAYSGEIVH